MSTESYAGIKVFINFLLTIHKQNPINKNFFEPFFVDSALLIKSADFIYRFENEMKKYVC